MADPAGADPRRCRLRRRHRLPHRPGRARVGVRGRCLCDRRRLRPGDDLRRAGATASDRPAAECRPPDRRPESVKALAERLPAEAWQTLPCRTSAAGEEDESRFAFVRVAAAHPVRRDHQPPRWEWLIIEWPAGEEAPSDYRLSNLPEDESPERLARLARLRWTIELDYRQLKAELGLDHYEGRSYLGFHHHCALVTCAHAFLTLKRLDPKVPRPA